MEHQAARRAGCRFFHRRVLRRDGREHVGTDGDVGPAMASLATCTSQAFSSVAISAKVSATLPAVTSRPWLRRIRIGFCPMLASSRGFSAASVVAFEVVIGHAPVQQRRVEVVVAQARTHATAMPAVVWVCAMQWASARAAWMALWITKPATFTGCGEASSLRPSTSILTRLRAVTSL